MSSRPGSKARPTRSAGWCTFHDRAQIPRALPVVHFDAEREDVMRQARFVVIREATEVVLRHLECLPPSDRREQLCASVQECMQDIEMWSVSSPTMGELDVLTKRVLALHIE